MAAVGFVRRRHENHAPVVLDQIVALRVRVPRRIERVDLPLAPERAVVAGRPRRRAGETAVVRVVAGGGHAAHDGARLLPRQRHQIVRDDMRPRLVDDLLVRLDHLRRVGMVLLHVVGDLEPRLLRIDLPGQRRELADRAVELLPAVVPQPGRVVRQQVLLLEHARVRRLAHHLARRRAHGPAHENRLGEATIDLVLERQRLRIDGAQSREERRRIGTRSPRPPRRAPDA